MAVRSFRMRRFCLKRFFRKKIDWRGVFSHLAFFVVGVAACAAFFVWRFGGVSVFPGVAKYASAMALVDEYYVGDADLSALTDLALSAAVDSLDRWSYYMTDEEYADYLDFSNNRYQGIGVTIRLNTERGGYEILELTRDGPAARAGVQIGDVITHCQGEDVSAGTTDDLKSLIQSAPDGIVELTLLAPDDTVRTVSVRCEEIQIDPVSWEMLDADIGYIRLENFEAGMAESAIAAVDTLIEQGAEGIVFDVRSNPGGRVSELCELLDHLVPEGDLFIRANKDGRESVERSDDEWVDIPLAVVVDADSYSAAEFFAAALREYDRAVIAGEATTGKGRSQVTFVLSDGSAVHLSRYVYLTPNRVDLSEVGGLVPDAEAALDDEQRSLFAAGTLTAADDPQIQAAVAALRP